MNIIDSLIELAAIVENEVSTPQPQSQQETELRNFITFKRAHEVALQSLSR